MRHFVARIVTPSFPAFLLFFKKPANFEYKGDLNYYQLESNMMVTTNVDHLIVFKANFNQKLDFLWLDEQTIELTKLVNFIFSKVLIIFYFVSKKKNILLMPLIICFYA